jgi:hypothetical protein
MTEEQPAFDFALGHGTAYVVKLTPRRAVYNALDSEKNKIRILGLHEENNAEWLEVARDVALQIATKAGVVTAQDVRKVLEAEDVYPWSFNAWGSLFRAGGFVPTGKWIASDVARHNARPVREWRLKGSGE